MPATTSPACAAGASRMVSSGGCEGRLHGAGAVHVGDAQLVARMGAERVVPHQLFGDAVGKLRVQSARQVGPLGVGLRADGHVLARRHRHRTRDETRDTRQQHLVWRRVRRSNADDEARRRHDAVVSPEHGGPQPADAVGTMGFGVTSWQGHTARLLPQRRRSEGGGWGYIATHPGSSPVRAGPSR